MDHLAVLREKIGNLRDEIAHLKNLNEEYRRQRCNETEAQIAHGQKHERLQEIQQELVQLADLGRTVLSVQQIAGLLTWIVVVTVINRVLRLSLPNYRCRTDAPVHAGHGVGAPFDGYRDLAGGWCRNRLDIPIEPLGAVDRRQRGAWNVRAFAHRHLEQISGVVSPDISPDDYSGGARGCAAATAPEQGPQRGLLRTEIKFHRRVSKIEPAIAASCVAREYIRLSLQTTRFISRVSSGFSDMFAQNIEVFHGSI
jgi:hypothetical protein